MGSQHRQRLDRAVARGRVSNNNHTALGQSIARRWRDPVAFFEQVLVNPETGAPFHLYPEQRNFFRRAYMLRPDGRLRYTEHGYFTPKKQGKTTQAAMAVAYVAIVLAPPNGEIYLLANDREQAQSRVFKVLTQILEASPLLRNAVTITNSKVTINTTGTTIIALPNDYRGFAGSNPTMNVYDETAYFTSEASQRLWDEGMPSPARKLSFRLSVSTAGFEGESSPLKDLYERVVLKGTSIGPDLYERDNALVFWSHRSNLAPWITDDWIAEQRAALRPTQFSRLIENKWVTSESIFIALTDWDAVTDNDATPVFSSPSLDVYAAVDASLKHDSTAIAAVAWVNGRLQLVNLRTFQPSPDAPLDFESTIEATLLEWRQRYRLREIRIDPWQMASVAQRLRKAGLHVVEYAQSLPNLSAMASNLYELVRSRALSVYPDPNLRRAVAQAVAVEGARGWVIKKEKQAHKIDPLIALAMAALAAVELKGVFPPMRTATFGSSPLEALSELFGTKQHDADLPDWDLGFSQRDGQPLPKPVSDLNAALQRGVK